MIINFNEKTSNKLKKLLLMPLLLLSSCGTYEYNFIYTSYKIQYRTLSSDAEKRYDTIEKNIDNSLGEKIVDIHKDLINYKGKKENQNDYDGNEFCKNYICILEGDISNYVIFGDNVTYYTIGTKEKITDQFYFVKDISDKNLQEKIDNIKIDLKGIIGK